MLYKIVKMFNKPMMCKDSTLKKNIQRCIEIFLK